MKTQKPKKPRADFPLFAHANGQWAKKIRGKLHYFGRWDAPDEALRLFVAQRDDLQAGRIPRATRDGLTVRDLCNRFLSVKHNRLQAGQLSIRSFNDYFSTAEKLINQFGSNRLVKDLCADDFELLWKQFAEGRGPVTIGNDVRRTRTIFKFAYESGLIDQPVRFGPEFKQPNRREIRKARNATGPKLLEAHEIQSLLDTADQPMKAMILLGINAAFGATDISSLPISAIDLERGWLQFPRPKTGIHRRCPLWSQTMTALRDASTSRPDARDIEDEDSVFLTRYGRRWVRATVVELDGDGGQAKKATYIDNVGSEFNKLLIRRGLKRPRLGFYALRHTFQTIAEDSRDMPAVGHIMGHADNSMAGVYRERVSDERLIAVSETVQKWLFAA